MYKIIFVFLFTISNLIAEDQLNDLSLREVFLSSESEPVASVAGCVNAVTGGFFQVETDLKTNTIDPICMTRFYDSQSEVESFFGHGFGSQFPYIISDSQKSLKHSYALLSQRDGSYLTYQGNLNSHGKDKKRIFEIDPRILKKGYTNTNGGEINGKDNLKNSYAEFCNDNNKCWFVKLGDGSRRYYTKKIVLNKNARNKLHVPTESAFLLTKEVKPNGNVLSFEYSSKNSLPNISKIKTLNRNETHVINEISISELPEGALLHSSCGTDAIYVIKEHEKNQKSSISSERILSYVSANQFGHTQYVYNNSKSKSKKIAGIHKLQGYQQLVMFDDDDKVSRLYHTVGNNNESLLTHKFSYSKGITLVCDCQGRETRYKFDDNKRVTEIQYYEKDPSDFLCEKNLSSDLGKFFNNTPLRSDIFVWSSEKGQEGWLQSKSVCSVQGTHYKKSFSYDDKGNVLSETIIGNITGLKPSTFNDGNERTLDKKITQYEYSCDDFNLKTKVIYPGGLSIIFEYLPGTNLVCAEKKKYKGKVQERILRVYDDNGEVIELSEDDGSGVDSEDYTDATYRRKKTITRVSDVGSSSFGKPKEERNYYVRIHERDCTLLNIVYYDYDTKGNLIAEHCYDSNGTLLSSVKKNYDSFNRVISEVNTLGDEVFYEYDSVGNKIREDSSTTGLNTQYFYNSVNKLIKKVEIYSNGTTLTTQFTYNPMGEKISETDVYGNRSHFSYDVFGNQIQVVLPITYDSNDTAIDHILKKSFNVLGQVIDETDAENNCTTYERNIFGQITKIISPDGSVESNVYSTAGLLKENVRSDGSKIIFSYSSAGRLLAKEYFDSKNTRLHAETFRYKGENLIESSDFLGLKTFYFYDPAGRLVEVQKGDKLTKFELDGLGRKTKIIEEDQVTLYKYDLHGNLVRETKQDLEGKIYFEKSSEYDSTGRLKSQKIKNTSFDCLVSYFYDSGNNLIEKIDECGNSYKYIFTHRSSNFGADLLEVTSINPNGIKLIKTFDFFNNCVKIQKYDNKLLFSEKRFYNHNNKIESVIVDKITESNTEGTYSYNFTYDNMGYLKESREENLNKTQFFHDSLGRLITKINSDNVKLNYSYDSLGRCVSIFSSDNSINYKYTFDAHDNLLEMCDLVDGSKVKRKFDVHDRLIAEELINGSVIKFDYDIHDRIKSIVLPDDSKILYQYDSFNLTKILRSKNNTDYVILCKEYDLRGNLLEFSTENNSVRYEYNSFNRIKKITSSSLEINYSLFDKLGNVLKEDELYKCNFTRHEYKYNSLNQLVEENEKVYLYDSLGNIIKVNDETCSINNLNQNIGFRDSINIYSVTGNLIYDGENNYEYDALGRLKNIKSKLVDLDFSYDGLNRCSKVKNKNETKHFFYHGSSEIGCYSDRNVSELKIQHPDESRELTFVVEKNNIPYQVQQDAYNNIVMLKSLNGDIKDFYKFTSFKEKNVLDESISPWRHGNRRQFGKLTQFAHRFYHQKLRSWVSQDPFGYDAGPNLYCYLKNNPLNYYDPDGRFAFAIPVIVVAFELGGAGITAIAGPSITACAVAATAATMVYGAKALDNRYGTNLCKSLFHPGLYVLNSEGESEVDSEGKQEGKYKEWVFPENPDDLMPEIEREKGGRIPVDDNIRISPEKHEMKPNESVFNPRHHGQHYHVESRENPGSKSWNGRKIIRHKPKGYVDGMGTGFLPGEKFEIKDGFYQ